MTFNLKKIIQNIALLEKLVQKHKHKKLQKHKSSSLILNEKKSLNIFLNHREK